MPEWLREIWTSVEAAFDDEYDYVLVHIYENGEHNIGYHRDREAEGGVASVSFGTRRTFRMRPRKWTSGYENTYELGEGDLIYMHPARACDDSNCDCDGMHPSCQDTHKHGVPRRKRITTPRINLTFRRLKSKK